MELEQLFNAVKQEQENFMEQYEHLEDLLETTARRNVLIDRISREPNAESAALFLMDFEMTKLAANPGDRECIVRLATLVATLASMSTNNISTTEA